MNGHDRSGPDDRTPAADDFAALDLLLASPAIWDDPDPGLEDRIVAEVTTQLEAAPRMPSAPGRSDRRHLVVIGAVAVLFLVVGVAVAVLVGDGSDRSQVALQGSDLVPGASATAEVERLDEGLRVVLRVTDLPPAEPGTYYQGWVRNDEGQAVTIGTFHVRGGDGEVELWAGVTDETYPTITVTLQQEGAGAESSGVVVLSGSADD